MLALAAAFSILTGVGSEVAGAASMGTAAVALTGSTVVVDAGTEAGTGATG